MSPFSAEVVLRRKLLVSGFKAEYQPHLTHHNIVTSPATGLHYYLFFLFHCSLCSSGQQVLWYLIALPISWSLSQAPPNSRLTSYSQYTYHILANYFCYRREIWPFTGAKRPASHATAHGLCMTTTPYSSRGKPGGFTIHCATIYSRCTDLGHHLSLELVRADFMFEQNLLASLWKNAQKLAFINWLRSKATPSKRGDAFSATVDTLTKRALALCLFLLTMEKSADMAMFWWA